VIFAGDKANFKQPLEALYTDKNICVTGTLKEYNNKPEIIISKPEQITIQ
jgi:DNA/RNA endonuclease YhcR with UshA esterase domain